MNLILKTDRLCIREFTLDDAAFILTLLNSEGWLNYIGERNIKTLDDAKLYISNTLILSYKKFGFGPYLVELKETAIPIGMSSLIKRDHLEDVDLGFALLPNYMQKTYAFEASKAVMNHAQTTLGIKKLVAITNPDNVASISLLKKLGFNAQGTVKIPNEEESLLYFSYT